MKVLLFTPPMTQINTPYPATSYLTGFLKSLKIEVIQKDPSIELVCKIFSQDGLGRAKSILSQKFKNQKNIPPSILFFLEAFDDYLKTVEPVIRFLQGKDPTLAHRISARTLVPEGPRFLQLLEYPDGLKASFGDLGIQDQAKHIASLYLDDLADMIREGIDENFQLSKYGEKLAASQSSFDHLENALNHPPTLIDDLLEEIITPWIINEKPKLVGMTVPFPGNVYGALRCGKNIKKIAPHLPIAMGGGYVNTELRDLSDPRIFNFLDYILLDDGERPLLCLIEFLEKKRPQEKLLRTFLKKNNQVQFISTRNEHDIPQKDIGMPTYEGLPLDLYISMLEMLNPMHRLWSDLRWNKLTLAHGCYWKKCNFCDTTLDYINRYDPAPVDLIIDRIEHLIKETGQSGFHFVDEAAPPALLKALSKRLIERKVICTWWGNIRFDKTFTPELTSLMSDAGCVAVSGGLEVASDRLLALMQKGVTVEQVARVTHSFRKSGILVHAYLMFGFPTETEQETIDSLERVRQLFAAGCIQSAFWHRFSATAHSPIGKNPEKFGIKVKNLPSKTNFFAENDLHFSDPTPCNHELLGKGLKKAVFNFMHGIGLNQDIQSWFEMPVRKTTVPKTLIKKSIT